MALSGLERTMEYTRLLKILKEAKVQLWLESIVFQDKHAFVLGQRAMPRNNSTVLQRIEMSRIIKNLIPSSNKSVEATVS